ncbi:MAG: OmpA family protein [Alphaproteobacteria bacterium]|nr:OmpA family protein [Alphaproteobacteria bacterium]
MRLLDYLFAFVALVGLVAASWWGVYQSPQNAANLQFRLQQETSSALKAAGMDWAVVNMDGQHAVLSGKAPSPDAVRDAALIVLSADGPGGLIFGGVTQVENAADSAPPVSPYVWRAEKTPEGAFVLSGHVPSKAIRKALLAEAALFSDGAYVEDHMQLATGAPAGNWQGMARLGLQQLARLSSGEVSLQDRRLRVNGVSVDPEVRAKVKAEISNVAAPFKGEPMIRGASLWLARVSDSGLVLKGNVSSESERREILTLARKHFKGDITDEMVIADQAYPGWMEGVRRGLPQFVRFQNGEMDFDPDGAGFFVTGQASPSALAYLREDLASLLGAYSANVAVDTHVPSASPSPLARDACQQLVSALPAASQVTFAAGGATLSRDMGEALDQLAAAIHSCEPALVFIIVGHGDAMNAKRADVELGRARAAFIADFLGAAAGIDAGRLSAIGYGPDIAEQAIDSADAGADSRQIEITVLERSE